MLKFIFRVPVGISYWWPSAHMFARDSGAARPCCGTAAMETNNLSGARICATAAAILRSVTPSTLLFAGYGS